MLLQELLVEPAAVDGCLVISVIQEAAEHVLECERALGNLFGILISNFLLFRYEKNFLGSSPFLT